MNLQKIIKIKNSLAIVVTLLLLSIAVNQPDDTEISLLGSCLIVLLPLSITNIIWNKKLYFALMADQNAAYAKSKLTYKMFEVIGLVLIILYSIMTIDMFISFYILDTFSW